MSRFVEYDGDEHYPNQWAMWEGRVDPVEAFAALPTIDARNENEDDEYYDGGEAGIETAKAGRDAGLTYTLAWELAQTNDDAWEDATPEERWAKFIAWIDETLAKPPLTRAAPKVKRHRITKARLPRASKAPALTASMGL